VTKSKFKVAIKILSKLPLKIKELGFHKKILIKSSLFLTKLTMVMLKLSTVKVAVLDSLFLTVILVFVEMRLF